MSKKKRHHGERNKSLSEDLFNGKIYFDWVITTAFYAAIHFVEDKILPCNVSSIPCKNISEVKRAFRMNGRHAARERLVFEKLPIDIAARYKWLDDRSRYSRYTSFKITPAEADKAQQYLNSIHKICCD